MNLPVGGHPDLPIRIRVRMIRRVRQYERMGTSRKRWRDLSPRHRTGIVIAAVVQIGLQAAALVDLRRRSAHKVRGDKRFWAAASFVNFAGPIAYFVRGRR